MKKCLLLLICVLAMLCLSCSSTRNVEGTNADGSPVWTQEIPKSNKFIYGVGRAKLSSKYTSQDAADVNANADLARNIQKNVKDGTASYISDNSVAVINAYERIIVQTVNLTLKGVVTEQRWLSPDGTAWTLVSFRVKDLPALYAEAANSYVNQLETENRALKEQSRTQNTATEGTIILNQTYSAGPDEKIEENEIVLNNLEKTGDFNKALASYLTANGFDLSGE